jgi:hypothetical protein
VRVKEVQIDIYGLAGVASVDVVAFYNRMAAAPTPQLRS